MNEQEIVDMYKNGRYTLRHLSDMFNTNHHMIKRILIRNGVEITKRNTLKEFSEEHRRRISESSKGRPCYWKGKTMPEEVVRKNMIIHMKLDIQMDDIREYTDFDKLKFLTGGVSRNIKHFESKEKYLAYIDFFYNDVQFNLIYALWVNSNKNKWYMPTLDHKQSKSSGGNWELKNLQFLTWFENRAKAEMSDTEWELFKKNTNTRSDLFI